MIVLYVLLGLYFLITINLCISIYKNEKRYAAKLENHQMPNVITYLLILLFGPFMILYVLYALVIQLKKFG